MLFFQNFRLLKLAVFQIFVFSLVLPLCSWGLAPKSELVSLGGALRQRSPKNLFAQPQKSTKVSAELWKDIVENNSSWTGTGDYENLPNYDGETYTKAGHKDENKSKNRYKNILPTDKYRVRLKRLKKNKIIKPDVDDYINASYVPDVEGKITYIATQAPTKATIDDFWLMAWEQNTTVIGMVTALNEKRSDRVVSKADRYWPEKVGSKETHGSIEVTMQKEEHLLGGSVIQRVFQLKEAESGALRTVEQYQYTSWPDHDVPADYDTFLEYNELVQKARARLGDSGKGLSLVHCSAGCGRTGVFVVYDQALRSLKKGLAKGATPESVVAEIVTRGREARHLVQSKAQYQFILKALQKYFQNELLSKPWQSVPSPVGRAPMLPAKPAVKTSKPRVLARTAVKKSNSDAFKEEEDLFATIGQFSDIKKRSENWKVTVEDDSLWQGKGDYANLTNKSGEVDTKVGRKAVNKPRNRYKDILPNDRYRVKLETGGNDYINASYIPDANGKNLYIATQAPTKATIGDFWQMVWEQKSSVIGMVTKLKEMKGDRLMSKADRYWPEITGKKEVHGSLEITMLDETDMAGGAVTHRTFQLKKIGTQEVHRVDQYQYKAWPDHSVPDNYDDFSSYYKLVREAQQNATVARGESQPYVVHCSAGCGRTGVFVIYDQAVQAIEKGLAEGETPESLVRDLVNRGRESRYLVQSEVQYQFILKSLQKHFKNELISKEKVKPSLQTSQVNKSVQSKVGAKTETLAKKVETEDAEDIYGDFGDFSPGLPELRQMPNITQAFNFFTVSSKSKGGQLVAKLSRETAVVESKMKGIAKLDVQTQLKETKKLAESTAVLVQKTLLAKGVALLEELDKALAKEKTLTIMDHRERVSVSLNVSNKILENFEDIDPRTQRIAVEDALKIVNRYAEYLSIKQTSNTTNFEVETLSTNKVALPTTKKGVSVLARVPSNSEVFMMDNLSNLGKVHQVEMRWVPFISTQTKNYATIMKFVAEYESHKANWLNNKSVANEESIKAAVEQNFKGVESKYRPIALNAEAITQSLMKMNRLELKQLRGEFHEYFEQLLNDPNKATILGLQQSLPLEGSEELRTILDLGGSVSRVAMKELVKGKRKVLADLIDSFLDETPEGQDGKSLLTFVGSRATTLHQKLENIARMKSFELSA